MPVMVGGTCGSGRPSGITERQNHSQGRAPVRGRSERGISKAVKKALMQEHAEEIERLLEPAIVAKKVPGAVPTLSGFVKDIYLPFVEKEHRNSTYDGYRDMWEDHVRRVAGDTLLRTDRSTYRSG